MFHCFSPDKLIFPLANENVSVERIETELRPSISHPHSVILIALVDELAMVLLSRGRPAGQRAYIEIRVGAAVERLQPHIGRKIGTKCDVHVAVERSEIARSRGIAAEQH